MSKNFLACEMTALVPTFFGLGHIKGLKKKKITMQPGRMKEIKGKKQKRGDMMGPASLVGS